MFCKTLTTVRSPFYLALMFQQQCKGEGQKQIAVANQGNQGKQNWSWRMKYTNFQGGSKRFQGKNITNSSVTCHISINSKCRAGKRSFIDPNNAGLFESSFSWGCGGQFDPPPLFPHHPLPISRRTYLISL